MLKNCLMPIVASMLVLLSTTAHAFFDPPYVTPASPVAGELVSVVIRGGVCDTIGGGGSTYPRVTRVGNAIRIVLFGVHATNTDFCNYPIGTAAFHVGFYPAGTYTLQVDLLYDNYPFSYATETLGIVPFTVANSPALATPAPTNSPLALAGLILVILGLGALALRTRRPGVLLIMLACLPFGARAQIAPDHQTIEISLTNASGTPTPARIVDSHTTLEPCSGSSPSQERRLKIS